MIKNKPELCLVLDVDGVLTDPQTKHANPSLLSKIEEVNSYGITVALNTGRSFTWLKEEILFKLPINVYFSCEKGSIWGKSDGRVFNKKIDDSVSIPKELKKEVISLINTKYSDCVFFDKDKETMATAEMKEDFPLTDFPKRLTNLSENMKEIIKKHDLDKVFKITNTTIAVEMESVEVGKNLGAKRILKMLVEDGLSPEEFITIGDDDSDALMTQEFNDNGFKTSLVYVGNSNLEIKYNFPVIITKNKFTEGTLEYIDNNLCQGRDSDPRTSAL